MPQRMRISRKGIELIKSFEGFSSRTVRVDDEHWVIGFGHIRKTKDSYRITRDEAEQVLREYDLPPFEALVLENTYTPLHQGAFDALVSFAFNIGKDAFLSSDVLGLLNAGETIAAAEAMGGWRKAKVGGRTMIVDALVRRRAAEKALFLGNPSGPAPAPSAIVRPVQDPDAKGLMPKERAVVVETSVKGDSAVAVERPFNEERRAGKAVAATANQTNLRLTRRFKEYLNDSESAAQSGVAAARSQGVATVGGENLAGPTPEEITKAISELVNGSSEPSREFNDEDTLEVDLLNGEEDTQPSEGEDFVTLEEARGVKRFQRTLDANDVGLVANDAEETPAHLIIDDLEEVQIEEEDIERALRIHEEMRSSGSSTASFTRWGPFALLSLLGAALCTWGMFNYSGQEIASQSGFSLDLLWIILGALLFLVMAYYFFREFVAED